MLQSLRRRWIKPRWALAGLVALGALALACGGGDDAAQATPAPLASPADMRSFRYEVVAEISGDGAADGGFSLNLNLSISASGAVIVPDRQQSRIVADLGFLKLDIESIQIGDRSWTREPGGDWSSEGSDAFGGLGGLGDFDLSPTSLFGDATGGEEMAALQALLATLDGRRETVNGVEAIGYTLDAEQFAESFGELAQGDGLPGLNDEGDLAVEVWIAVASGFPVRLIIDGTSVEDGSEGEFRLELNITDINSDDIEIEPPV